MVSMFNVYVELTGKVFELLNVDLKYLLYALLYPYQVGEFKIETLSTQQCETLLLVIDYFFKNN